MSLLKRIEKLEVSGSLNEFLPRIIGVSIVNVGQAHLERKLMGYEVNGGKFWRSAGEPMTDFVDRVILESGHKNNMLPLAATCLYEEN